MAGDTPERRAERMPLPDLDDLRPGWGRQRLAAVAPDRVDEVGFAKAPAVFRSEQLPVEVREGFADLWDGVAAEVIDFVAINGAEELRSRAGRKRLWKRLERILALAQLLSIRLGHTYPLPTGRWGHRALGTGGSGGIALLEQVSVGAATISGPTSPLVLATVGAAMTELLEVYVASSARVERYRHAARRPSFETLATDLGALYGAKGLGTRPSERRIVEEAMRTMLTRVIRRSQWRFGQTLLPAIGPVLAGGMTAAVVTRAQRPALREPDATERQGGD